MTRRLRTILCHAPTAALLALVGVFMLGSGADRLVHNLLDHRSAGGAHDHAHLAGHHHAGHPADDAPAPRVPVDDCPTCHLLAGLHASPLDLAAGPSLPAATVVATLPNALSASLSLSLHTAPTRGPPTASA